jgi:putative transcriptional regulator
MRGNLARALVAAALVVVALATESAAQTRPRLTGRLLVATEAIRDPRFVRTVVYIVRHDADGAFGVVLNRPLGEMSIEDALKPFGLEVPPSSGQVRVNGGGPVQPRAGGVLHTGEWTGEDTIVIDTRFSFTRNPKVLQAIGKGTGPRRALFFLGYAGWAAGQLEGELARDSWGIALADEALVFEDDPERMWRDATARRLLDL